MATTATTGHLHDDGFCILPGLFGEHLLARARREVPAGGGEVVLWYRDACSPALLELLTTGAVAAAMRRRLGSAAVFCSVKAVAKGAQESRPSPWHQDRPYWGGSIPKYSLWIALDDATPANGCLRVLPGSHRRERPHRAGSWRGSPRPPVPRAPGATRWETSSRCGCGARPPPRRGARRGTA